MKWIEFYHKLTEIEQRMVEAEQLAEVDQEVRHFDADDLLVDLIESMLPAITMTVHADKIRSILKTYDDIPK